MSRATSITAKIDAVLRKVNATDRVVSKRVVVTTGGDPLLGRGVTASYQDTVLDPQPAIIVASANYPLVIAGTALSADAEYLMTVSVTAMTREEVTNPVLSVIFTDAKGNVEELFIVGFQAVYLNGQDIVFQCILASKKRG